MKTFIGGLLYGDEGKGRISYEFSKNTEWAVRFNGGPNAGHTVWHGETEHKLHQLPAGAVAGKKVALDTGMVIDMSALIKEVKTAGVDPENIYISENVHLITPAHKRQDMKGSGIGSTKKGIAYVYADRAKRLGIRVTDLPCCPFKTYKGLPPISPNESAVYEGAQGMMIDVDYGGYPYVTSSSILPHVGHRIDKVVGVVKAYVTRVGDGPPNYPEMEWLSDRGAEFGATTGRKRKSYWLIMDELRYALSIMNPDEIIVTKLDILDGVEISVWDNGLIKPIGGLDSYKNFLLENFPKIKYFSESPSGPMIEV